MRRKVFDAHFHIGFWDQRKSFGKIVRPLLKPTEKDYTPGQEHRNYIDVQQYLNHYNISGGLVVCNYLADDPEYSIIDLNKVVIEATEKCKNLYAGIFVSPIKEDWDYSKVALSMLDHAKVRVLKMTATHWGEYSPDPSSWDADFRNNFEEIIQNVKDNDLVMQFHSGYLNSEPIMFDKFLNEYGDQVSVHLVHSGETCYHAMQYTTLIREWLDKGYRVYSDISLAPGFVLPKILSVLDESEIEHVMFATDAPWGNFVSEYGKVEDLDVSDETKDQIFFSNASKLYKIDHI